MSADKEGTRQFELPHALIFKPFQFRTLKLSGVPDEDIEKIRADPRLDNDKLLNMYLEAYAQGDVIRVLRGAAGSENYAEYMTVNLDLFRSQPWWAEMLVTAWSGTNERMGGTLPRDLWLDLFQTADRAALRSAGDTLPDVDTIYRGTQIGDAGGFSWTSDKDMAEWFASRHKNPLLLTRVFDESELLFFTHQREESEFVMLNQEVQA